MPAMIVGLTLLMLTGAGDDARTKLFREQVRPVLVSQCLNCHDGHESKGKLDLSRRSLAIKGGENGPAFEPGKPDESLLLEKLDAGEMPPDKPLRKEEIEAFRSWIKSGSAYDEEPLAASRKKADKDWWSLKPVVLPRVPTVADPSGWIRTPVDAFILAKLKEKQLSPAPEADRLTLIRRARFDLTGMPPTPEEVTAFLDDRRPDAYERLINRLLDSPAYGERWARHWLDAVRFGESHGYETNSLRPNAWPYRDYVIRAFNRDLPYPEFILDQLAGDTRAQADWLTQSATGFLVGGTHDIVGNQTIEGQRQQRMDDLDDIITAVGSAFLGLTVNCARCHDHKFDPIAQRDYYALQAVLTGVQHNEREVIPPDGAERLKKRAVLTKEIAAINRQLDILEPVAAPLSDKPLRERVNAQRNVDRFHPLTARSIRFNILATNDGAEPCLDEVEAWTTGPDPGNVALAEHGGRPFASSEAFPGSPIHKIIHLNDGQAGNSRSWISEAKSRGWAKIEWGKPVQIDRVVWGRDREGRYADRLATHYFIEAETAPGVWQVVASSVDRQAIDSPASPNPARSPAEKQRAALVARRKALQEEATQLSNNVRVYVGSFMQPGATHRLERGDPMREAEQVAPGAIGVIKPALLLKPDSPEAERRLAFARWLGDADNPLPARVMMNRVWHLHFGRGMVATPGDFGLQGGEPSHPELLDWLASTYRATGFRLKPMHRLLMTSAAYRQSSRLDEHAQSVDKDNRWLWRKSPTRVDAESLRDAILSVSGALDRKMGGPGYSLWEKNTNYVTVFTPLNLPGADTYRRMVYQFKPRSQADPTFGAFDCPDAALVAPRRNVSTTALQSLNLLNSPFVLEQSRLFAGRIAREAGTEPGQQVDRAFRLAFGRPPNPVEAKAAVSLIQDAGTPALARALFNSNEFLYGR